VIQPDALPLRIAGSHAALSPDDVRVLFGAGYALRGSEHVFVTRTSRGEVRVPVTTGAERRLVLDALDQSALGGGAPLRLRGPAGSIDAPAPTPVRRALRLPAALVKAWGLKTGQAVTIQAGAVAFGDVMVEEGEGHVRLGRADALAAGLRDADTVRWNRDVALTTPSSPPEEAARAIRTTGRLITENDVRQARLRGQQIVVRPDHIVTPAAHSLGRELGILRRP
jgi:hypothetical protein